MIQLTVMRSRSLYSEIREDVGIYSIFRDGMNLSTSNPIMSSVPSLLVGYQRNAL